MSETAVVQGAPEDLLADVTRRRARTRTQVRGAWLPLAVFGLLTLITIPLYLHPFAFPHGGTYGYLSLTRTPFFAGLPDARSQDQAWLFWLVAGPAGYLVCALWDHRRARRTGLSPRWDRFVAVGLGLLALLAATHLVPVRTILTSRYGDGSASIGAGFGIAAFLTPLVTVALGLLVLAWVDRSWIVGTTGLVYGALVVTINVYGYGNIPVWITRTHPATKPYLIAPAHNLVALAVLLFLGSAATAVSARWARGR